MNETDYDFEPAVQPHRYVRCESRHLFPREEHCSYHCGSPAEHPIHAEQVAA